jgi:phospholipase/carboxylesterase
MRPGGGAAHTDCVKSLLASRTQAEILVVGHPIYPRRGPRPLMPDRLPHVQADQWPPAAVAVELLARATRLPGVEVRQSRMASAATSALSLAHLRASRPPEAFIDATEFCHILPPPEGTLHLTLPPAERVFAIEFGWGEAHPVGRAGSLSHCLVTLYAPRDRDELEMVLKLVESSWEFAGGGANAEALDD